MKFAISRLLTIGLVAVIAVAGSIAGRAVWETVTATDDPKAEPPPLQTLNDEAAKPKFEGEVMGFFVGPPGARVPDKFVTGEELCGSQFTEQVSWDKAGELDLAVNLPEPFRFIPDSMNTGTIACGDTVYAARWDYAAPQPSGYPGSLVIARSRFKYDEFDVSTERVTVTEIGGLPAVYIQPLSPNGIGSAAGVIFPGDAVTTLIKSSGVPSADLLKVAEIVAAEMKKGE